MSDSSDTDKVEFDGDEPLIEMPDLAELGIDIDSDGEPDAKIVTPAAPARPGPLSRLVGLLAMVLGVIGIILMAFLAAVTVRTGFTASSIVDRALDPVESAFDRMEGRIDETDDLVDRDGIPPERVDELQARVDGLLDLTTGARQVFDSIEDNPLYSLLPADLAPLGDALAEFETSAADIDRRLGAAADGDELSTPVVNAVADQVDDMQREVSDVRDMFESTASSLRRWIRLGTLLGFVGSLWGLWAQVTLTRRGWRGFRGRPV